MKSIYTWTAVLLGSMLLASCGGSEGDTSAVQRPPAPGGLFFGYHKPTQASSLSSPTQLGSVALNLPSGDDAFKGEFSFQYDAACQNSNNLIVSGLKTLADIAASGTGKFDQMLNSGANMPMTVEFAGDFAVNPALNGAGFYGGRYARRSSEAPFNNQAQMRRYEFCDATYSMQPRGDWFVFAIGERYPKDYRVGIDQNTNQLTWTLPSGFVPQTALISFHDFKKLTAPDETALVRQITTTAIPARINLPTDFELSEREYVITVQLFDANLQWGATGQTRVTF